MNGMTNAERSLLTTEWLRACPFGCRGAHCATCEAEPVLTSGRHFANCAHDLALTELGYPDQESRERGRAVLLRASAPTMAPPSESR